jgi:hypothetical protein
MAAETVVETVAETVVETVAETVVPGEEEEEGLALDLGLVAKKGGVKGAEVGNVAGRAFTRRAPS